MKTKIYFLFLLFILSAFKIHAQYAGNALQFDGVNDYVSIGNVNLNLTNTITFMAWIKWDINPSSGNNFTTIISNNSSAVQNDGQFYFRHNSSNTSFEFGIVTTKGGKSVSGKTSPQNGIWYHIAGVYTGSKIYIYVNGIPEDSLSVTGNFTPFINTMNLTLAESAKNTNNYRRFAGVIDEVSIWSKPFSHKEILEITNLVLTGNENGLIAYWNMNETSGNTVNDMSTNIFNGTNTGTANIITSTAPLSGTLPVELLYFNTKCNPDTNVEISWATASETNNNYFTVLKSIDLINWIEIGTIQGAGTSNAVNFYTLSDKKPETHDTYYKLMQTDFDGKSEAFKLQSILCKYNH